MSERMEKRRLPRHELVKPVEICDRLSQSGLGRLVNIHREGLMIVGNHLCREENVYQVDLHLPEPVNGRTVISLQLDCLWARETDSGSGWAGFRILDISDQAARDIDTLVSLYGLYEGEVPAATGQAC